MRGCKIPGVFLLAQTRMPFPQNVWSDFGKWLGPRNFPAAPCNRLEKMS